MQVLPVARQASLEPSGEPVEQDHRVFQKDVKIRWSAASGRSWGSSSA